MRTNRNIHTLAFAALLAIGLVTTAAAHHAVNSEFDVSKNVAAVGVLTKFELINPHSYVHFDIKNAAGKMDSWSFETGAPGALKRAGIAVRDVLKPGESYKIVYSPARKPGRNVGLLTSVTLPDGRFVAFGATNNVEAARELSK